MKGHRGGSRRVSKQTHNTYAHNCYALSTSKYSLSSSYPMQLPLSLLPHPCLIPPFFPLSLFPSPHTPSPQSIRPAICFCMLVIYTVFCVFACWISYEVEKVFTLQYFSIYNPFCFLMNT